MTAFRAALFAVLGAAAVLAGGCQDSPWWDYRDEPYLADAATAGEEQALRNVNSVNHDQRAIALRYLAYQAGARRARGDAAGADRLEGIIVQRYLAERNGEVRATIVRICAPAVGPGSRRVVEFLRGRIAAGEYPGYAALSLAYLSAPGAVVDIEPLTRHPTPDVRYQAAVALTVLRDPRGFEAVNRIWRTMKAPPWPDFIEGVPLETARQNLSQHALRGFGRPLNQ